MFLLELEEREGGESVADAITNAMGVGGSKPYKTDTSTNDQAVEQTNTLKFTT